MKQPKEYDYDLYVHIVRTAKGLKGAARLVTKEALELAENECLRIALINGDTEPLKDIRWALDMNQEARKCGNEYSPGVAMHPRDVFAAILDMRDARETEKAHAFVASQKAYMESKRRRIIAIGNETGITEVAPGYEDEQAELDDLDSTYDSLGVVR